VKLKVSTSSEEYASAEEMVIDEAGIDLFINGELELGGSFENLDSFQLAYAVLPEDFYLEDTSGFLVDVEKAFVSNASEFELEQVIWIASQELAKRRGYAK
jgi:hypothetical protein